MIEDYWDSLDWFCQADINCIFIIPDDWDEVCTSVDGVPLSIDTFTLRCANGWKGYDYNLDMKVENYSDCVAQSCGKDDMKEIVNGTQNNYAFMKRFLLSEGIDCYDVDEGTQLTTGSVFGITAIVILFFLLLVVCMKYIC